MISIIGERSWGSSPRMRGARFQFAEFDSTWRIIPADAGSTRQPLPHMFCRKDHPRGCGEHLKSAGAGIVDLGSSPRMRGAPLLDKANAAVCGIIPADAGSTCRTVCWPRGLWDHPRGCGEHLKSQSSMSAMAGSSPRMRGAHRADLAPRILHGIIPADAGSTVLQCDYAESVVDHPRGCGEHYTNLYTGSQIQGSSPPMRGTRLKKRL